MYLTQWFDPEPAFKGADFAQALKRQGLDVEVVTGFPNYPGGKLYPSYRLRLYQREVRDGLVIHRLPLWPSHNVSPLGRVLNYVSFFLSTLIFGLLRGGRFDAVYVYHPPITPSAAAAVFSAVHRRPMAMEVQDLWPDSVASSGMAGGIVVNVLGWICRFVYARAKLIVTQSDGMRALLIERGVPAEKLVRLYNWATYLPSETHTSNAHSPAFANRPSDEIRVVYGGNIGQAQALTSVIDAVVQARMSCPALHLHLFGSGIERTTIADYIARTAQDAATLHEPVDRKAMDRIFDAADLLVLHLRGKALYDITIPSKLQHYLAVGKPVVAGLAGEAASLLMASEAARVCPPEDVAAMSKAFVEIGAMTRAERAAMGARGKSFYAHHLGFEPAVAKTVRLIEALVPATSMNSRRT